jgi:acetyl esterase/lipase
VTDWTRKEATVPIHPWLAERFPLIRDIPSMQAALADPALGARLQQYLVDPRPWSMPAGVEVSDERAGSVPVRVFRPQRPSGAALLWLHGGGFIMGSIDDTESMIPAAELAARSGAVVVSAGYRLAVDGVRYPAPLDDAVAAWHWLAGQGHERAFAGGASVGAGLATGIAVRARDAGETAPAGLLLAYPIEHYPVPPAEQDLSQLPAMLRFPPVFQQHLMQNYLGSIEGAPADAIPGNHDVSGLPETWIAAAEYDDLRPSADRFADQLATAGVPVHRHLAEGMVHGFLGRGPSLEPVDAALEFFAQALR